jgi:Kef-type K+ transport system membrane component KefB/Trk K+ transport system NAD-binding subunit
LATLALAIPGGFLINRAGLNGDPWLLAFILSATSLGVLLPILKERQMLSGQFGQFVFVSATLADFVTVILLTVYIITLDKGFDLEIFSISLLFIVFLLLYRFGPLFTSTPRVRRFVEELSRATVQIKVRGAIGIFMAFVVLAEFVGAELILGAFLAGMIISLIKRPEDTEMVHKLEAFGFGFFIPVFFILVGVDLDVRALFESPNQLLLLPVVFIVALIVKVGPVFLLRGRFGNRDLFAGGLLLNTHLSLEVAVAVIGVRTGLFDAATNATIILFAVITVLVMPFLFSALVPFRQEEVERFALLVGVNDTGFKVGQELQAYGDPVRFLENEPRLVRQAEAAGFQVIEAEKDLKNLETQQLSQVSSVLILSRDDDQNLTLATQAKALSAQNVVVVVNDPNRLPEFQALGVKTFTSAIHRVTMITMMARNPDALAMLTTARENRELAEVQMRNPVIAGARLRNLGLPGDFLVLSLRRNLDLMVPRGETTVEIGDRLTMMGNVEDVRAVKKWLEGSSGQPPSRRGV